MRKKNVIIFFIFMLVVLFIASIHPFLAINNPIKSDILVVDGWLPDVFLKSAITDFNNGNYKHLITLGGPIQKDTSSQNYLTIAERAANKIIQFGLDKKFVISVPYFNKTNHQAFTSFLTLRNWLSNSDLKISAINIFTAGVHGRKSYTICKKVMGKKIKIGVISKPPLRYTPKYWWLSIRGIKLVIKNSVGYLYALFL